jgi:hypothetical protein
MVDQVKAEDKLVVARPLKAQESLEKRLEVAIAKCFARYFEAGGQGAKRINIDNICKTGFKQGVLSHCKDNLKRAAVLLDRPVGYVAAIKELEPSCVQLQAQEGESAKVIGEVINNK